MAAAVHGYRCMPSDDLAAVSQTPLFEQLTPKDASVARASRLRAMVETHHATCWRFLRRLGLPHSDADDAMQDVLLVVMRKLDDIETRAERAFMLRTAYRIGCRKRARRPQLSEQEQVDPTAHPDVLVDHKRARQLLDAILARMSDDLRAVFVLYEIERLTMAEIAETLEIKPGTVASRLRRAREDFDTRVARMEKRLSFREVKR